MRESICNRYNQQGVNLQSLQTACTAQHKKKTPNIPSKNGQEDVNRHFFKEDIQIAKRHMKRSATLLIIRKV